METSASNLTLHRYKRTNQGFVEDLGNGVTLTLMLIPAGEFLMGSVEDEPDSRDEERPQHLVRVPQFLMGRYPVIQRQWRAVAGLEKVAIDLNPEPSGFKGDNHPVEQVSWFEAVEFCKRLSVQTGREYGLPSEAEWEYACRAGTEAPYHFGVMISSDIGNFRGGLLAEGPEGSNGGRTTPVTQFGVANVFGLCDMHGNVWEWCQDHWHDNYEQAPTDGSAWLTSNKNIMRVLRGGSWYSRPWYCCSASRFVTSSGHYDNTIGFRVTCHARETFR
ncbi:formylglycine-generating enzyme family protein [Leptolyngbya sp. Heron Island J]|uniref:formylglycine-generating enzyme family protein n=1 Tax=Leptolyngbya sp. Heron Island J TaxID=1385935 RepID=UPI0004CDE0DE|nr:formylglycine-generating enzyme family protein [Leptolyngbya sp. Heron Island J]